MKKVYVALSIVFYVDATDVATSSVLPCLPMSTNPSTQSIRGRYLNSGVISVSSKLSTQRLSRLSRLLATCSSIWEVCEVIPDDVMRC